MKKIGRFQLNSYLAISGLLILLGCEAAVEQEPVVKPVKTMVLGQSAGSGQRVFPGTVQAAQRARLSFRVSGPLTSRPVKQGQKIRKGALLAQIDPRDFETRIKNLEAQLANLQARRKAMEAARPEDIRRLEANLAVAQARLLEADATFRRYQRLYENDNVSKAEFDQRRAARDVAQANVRSAEEALGIGRIGARDEDIQAMDAQIRALQAQIEQAQDNLRDTALRAPYDGSVAETYVENFEYVRAQQEILSLQDVSVVEIVAQIPENVVALARKDASPDFRVRFESLPDQEFAAKLTEIATQADPVTRTYAVAFQTPQPEQANIFAGMTAEVVLEAGTQAEDVFNVPVAAVFTDENGKQCLWILEEQSMTTRKAEVKVGDLMGSSARILAGVAAGDTVVTAGANYLTEGQKVRQITDELRDRR